MKLSIFLCSLLSILTVGCTVKSPSVYEAASSTTSPSAARLAQYYQMEKAKSEAVNTFAEAVAAAGQPGSDGYRERFETAKSAYESEIASIVPAEEVTPKVTSTPSVTVPAVPPVPAMPSVPLTNPPASTLPDGPVGPVGPVTPVGPVETATFNVSENLFDSEKVIVAQGPKVSAPALPSSDTVMPLNAPRPTPAAPEFRTPAPLEARSIVAAPSVASETSGSVTMTHTTTSDARLGPIPGGQLIKVEEPRKTEIFEVGSLVTQLPPEDRMFRRVDAIPFEQHPEYVDYSKPRPLPKWSGGTMGKLVTPPSLAKPEIKVEEESFSASVEAAPAPARAVAAPPPFRGWSAWENLTPMAGLPTTMLFVTGEIMTSNTRFVPVLKERGMNASGELALDLQLVPFNDLGNQVQAYRIARFEKNVGTGAVERVGIYRDGTKVMTLDVKRLAR